MIVGAEDLKQIEVLIKALKRTKFEDLTGPEVLGVAFAFQWLGEIKERINVEINPQSTSAPTPVFKEDKPPIKKATTVRVKRGQRANK